MKQQQHSFASAGHTHHDRKLPSTWSFYFLFEGPKGSRRGALSAGPEYSDQGIFLSFPQRERGSPSSLHKKWPPGVYNQTKEKKKKFFSFFFFFFFFPFSFRRDPSAVENTKILFKKEGILLINGKCRFVSSWRRCAMNNASTPHYDDRRVINQVNLASHFFLLQHLVRKENFSIDIVTETKRNYRYFVGKGFIVMLASRFPNDLFLSIFF